MSTVIAVGSMRQVMVYREGSSRCSSVGYFFNITWLAIGLSVCPTHPLYVSYPY